MNAKRILTVALVLIVALTPFGFAEETYASLTLNNFHFELGNDKPVNVNASVKVGYGGQLPDGPARLDVDIQGGGKQAISGSAFVQDGALRVMLNKSKFYYQIPLADFEKSFFEEAQYEMRYAPMYMYSFGLDPYDYGYDYYDYYSGYSDQEPVTKEDVQKFFDLMGRYVNLLQKYSGGEASKEFDRKMIAALNPEAKGVEKVKVFGKSMDLYCFDLTLEEKDFQKYSDAMYAADPEYKALD
jgi:hypothetical protein